MNAINVREISTADTKEGPWGPPVTQASTASPPCEWSEPWWSERGYWLRERVAVYVRPEER